MVLSRFFLKGENHDRCFRSLPHHRRLDCIQICARYCRSFESAVIQKEKTKAGPWFFPFFSVLSRRLKSSLLEPFGLRGATDIQYVMCGTKQVFINLARAHHGTTYSFSVRVHWSHDRSSPLSPGVIDRHDSRNQNPCRKHSQAPLQGHPRPPRWGLAFQAPPEPHGCPSFRRDESSCSPVPPQGGNGAKSGVRTARRFICGPVSSNAFRQCI